jgi:hypothetical protein
LKLLRQLQLTCFRMIFWTTSEVHCGSVVFATDVSFVECCPGQPYEPCLVPEGRSGEALIQSSRSGSIVQHINELVCVDAAWTVQLFCTCNSGPLNRPPTPGLSRLAGWSNPILTPPTPVLLRISFVKQLCQPCERYQVICACTRQ